VWMREAGLKLIAALILIAPCVMVRDVQAQQIQFTGDARGSNEVPPLQSSGSGKALATYDRASKALSWIITYSGLSSRPTAIHFHGPADPTRNAGIVLPVTGNLDSPVQGTAVLTDGQAADLMAGRWYLNIHTAGNPAGELRAQMRIDR
jgi:hypothetical protein